jgi:ABC-2 type transport system ATP-binding protein
MVAGVLDPDAGDIDVDGQDMHPGALAVKGQIGYVPQDIALYPDLTGRENLRFFASLYHLRRREATERTTEVLDVVGLADRADDQVKTYSGGMKRRINIAIGLIHRPRLLILDEPTVGVDPQSRNSILESVARLSAEGMAVLYTTHYMEEAERLCDRVGIIDLGELKAEGTRRELVSLVGQRDQVMLALAGNVEAAARACSALEAVHDASPKEEHLELVVDEARKALPRILETVADAGASVRAVEVIEPNLEAVFLHLTGKALRD